MTKISEIIRMAGQLTLPQTVKPEVRVRALDIIDESARLVDSGKKGNDFVAGMQQRFPDMTPDEARRAFELDEEMRLNIAHALGDPRINSKSKH